MAVRSVATTDTLDTFRTTFNSLASTDLGDVATLTTSASSIVGAVNELNSSVAGDLVIQTFGHRYNACLLYTSPSPRDRQKSRMPSSA